MGALSVAQHWVQPHLPGSTPNTGGCQDPKWLFTSLRSKANQAVSQSTQHNLGKE